jgi:2-succinyl-6-hydroxy-2,4-cyclohexadiene-1-carboxylate synthase
VLVHGFTQTSDCWAPVDAALAEDHDLVAVDAPGHRGSSAVEVDLPAGAAAITEVGGSATYLGYSMGARFCLRAALDHPALVEALVLVSGTAGIDDDAARAERRTADERLADRVLALGTEGFVDEWLAQPLFASLPPGRAHRRERLANIPAGLASSLLLAGTGAMEPLWHRLDELSMPVLVVVGALDAKYVALGRRLVSSIGSSAELSVVADAGHTVHLEQPDAFVDQVRSWLASVGRA